jgi:hypothetical protein
MLILPVVASFIAIHDIDEYKGVLWYTGLLLNSSQIAAQIEID